MTKKPARSMWRFLRREGGDYVFVGYIMAAGIKRYPSAGTSVTRWYGTRRVPVERFWGGAR